LWDLSRSNIESICIAWRKGTRCIWQLPNTTHSVLLPVLSDTLPLLDLFFVHMLSFVHRCRCSESPLVNFMVRHGILYGQMDSIIGRNASPCSFRYNICLHNIINLHFRPCDLISYSRSSTYSSAFISPLLELLQCRDGSLYLSSSDFNMTDISAMINSLCTC